MAETSSPSGRNVLCENTIRKHTAASSTHSTSTVMIDWSCAMSRIRYFISHT